MKQYVAEATAELSDGLQGRHSVGRCRGERVKNTMPVAGAEALATFIDEVARKHG
ncbi:MAG: hypothetical protein R3D98_02880 [Candidatus Krumholzibacteriia bacterium]